MHLLHSHELHESHSQKHPYMGSGKLRPFCLILAIAKDTQIKLMCWRNSLIREEEWWGVSCNLRNCNLNGDVSRRGVQDGDHAGQYWIAAFSECQETRWLTKWRRNKRGETKHQPTAWQTCPPHRCEVTASYRKYILRTGLLLSAAMITNACCGLRIPYVETWTSAGTGETSWIGAEPT